MTAYLDEEMMASGEVIGFPKLKLCMGFVVLVEKDAKRHLIGIHLSNVDKTSRSIPLFKNHMLDKEAGIKIVALYGSCNRVKRYEGSQNLTASWKQEMAQIAGLIGYKGVARGFDTGIIGPRSEGTFVQYSVNVMSGFPVRIFYKQDDRMVYGKGGAQSSHVAFATQTVIPDELKNNAKAVAHLTKRSVDHVDQVDSKGSASIKSKHLFGEKSLNEVDYRLRLDEIFVA